MASKPMSPPAARAGAAEMSSAAATSAASERAVGRPTDVPPCKGGDATTVKGPARTAQGRSPRRANDGWDRSSLAQDAIAHEPALEPGDADQVVDPAPQAIAHAVLAPPPRARAVAHGHLHDARAAKRAQRGQEAMDPHEHGQSLERLAAIGLERAADVGHGIAQHRPPG